MEQSVAGLTIASGSGNFATTTTAAKFDGWAANASVDARAQDGDVSCRADYANDRVLVQAPGRYEVHLDLSATIDSAVDMIFDVRKNATVISDLRAKKYFITTNYNQVSLDGFFNVVAADNPKTVGTFSDTSATTTPPAQVTWAGAPRSMVPIELYITAGSGTPTLTIESAHLNVKRVG